MKPYRSLSLSLKFILLLTLFSCTNPNRFKPTDDPPPSPICLVPERIRLALVLGGGGAKGMAHVGVLEEFEAAGIPIDLIVGCSAGSIVGALYSDDPDIEKIKCILKPLKTKSLLDVNIFTARYGLSQGSKLRRVLKRHLDARYFEELKIPLIVVATDLYTGEVVRIGGGSLIPAIQASCAVPFVFVPVQIHGRVLVDGGVADPVPARTARDLGAELVVAVDLGHLLPKTFPSNLFSVATRCAEISMLWQSENCANHADIVLRPECGNCGLFEDGRMEEIYEAGRRAAREVIPLIKHRLGLLGHLESHCGEGDAGEEEVDTDQEADHP